MSDSHSSQIGAYRREPADHGDPRMPVQARLLYCLAVALHAISTIGSGLDVFAGAFDRVAGRQEQ